MCFLYNTLYLKIKKMCAELQCSNKLFVELRCTKKPCMQSLGEILLKMATMHHMCSYDAPRNLAAADSSEV